MNNKLKQSLAVYICAFICWLVPSIIWASVEVDGIYYDLNTTAKTASVASNPNYYSGAVDIPSSFVYNGSTYSVKSISSRAFLSCSELISINFPSSVTTIGSSAFERCTGLTDVVIGSGVTLIDYEAFKNCSNLRSLTLPSSLKTIENETFSGCTSLVEIIAKRTTPPTIVNTTFDGVDKTACIVYVPDGCQSTYAKAANWKAFSNIIERTVVATGSCGDNVTYTIYSDKSMVISGTGHMCDFFIGVIEEGEIGGEDVTEVEYNTRVNDEYWSQVKNVTIEEGVTSIGEYAFSYCTDLVTIKIPNSVTSIGAFSFINCTNLTTITIPSSVAVIGDYAFSCSGLTHFTIEDGCVALLFGSSRGTGIEFFEECPLEYVYMGRNITTNNREGSMDMLVRWGDVTFPPFSGQSSLKTLVIGDNVTILEDYSFSGTPLQSLVIGKNVQTLGMYALSSANIGETLTIPSNVKKIGDCCLSPKISKLVIEKGDNDLELYEGTYSTELSLFGINGEDETIVESVYVGRNLTYSTYARNRFVSAYIDAELTAIPETVEYDDEGNVVSVLSYKPSPIEATNLYFEDDAYIGEYYFNNCSVEHIYNLDPSRASRFAFYNCGVKSISFNMNGSTTIGPDLFVGCCCLTSLAIPDGVTEIDACSFIDCKNLASVTIPNSVTSIGFMAFYNCKLNDVYVGQTPAQIDESTFVWLEEDNEEEDNYHSDDNQHTLHVPFGCKSVYENAEYWDYFDIIVEDGGNLEILATGSCGENDVTYTIYSDMTMVISGTGNMDMLLFADHPTYDGYCHSIKKVIIEEGVSGIGPYAFNECTGMISVTIPSTVNEIFTTPFAGSISLTTMTVASGNTTYDSRDNCNAIIETSTNTLIAGCKNSIIPNSVTSIGDGAFISCTGLTSVTIPNSVTSIGKNAFSACTGLTTINIPNSVTSIGRGAFYNCTGLTSVTVEGETPASVGNNAFYNVDKTNCILYVPTGSKTAYESAEGWKDFQNIVELGEESDTDISVLDNAIYVEQIEGRIGGTLDIPMKLKNSYPVRGFQFTLELPEGATINSWALSTNRLPSGAALSDKIATQKIEGNKITVACSLNYGDATFIGNDGEIATVNVSFGDDMEVGTYPIYLTSCDVTTASGVDEDLSDVKASLVLEDYVVGDANGDGKVRIGDATTILNYIVGTTSDNFKEKAADANGDGKIRIGDATTILNIIVNQ